MCYNSTKHSRATFCRKVCAGIVCLNNVCRFIVCYIYPDESAPRFQRLSAAFETPTTEVYLLFYQSALQSLVHFNKFLQREDPLIPIVCEQMESFLTKLASKFLPVSSIKAAKGDFRALKYTEREQQQSGIAFNCHTGFMQYLF